MDRVREALERRWVGQRLSKADVKAIREYEEKRTTETWWARARRLPQQELLALLDANEEQAKRWRAAGLQTQREGRRVYYNVPAVLAWLKHRWQGGADGDGPEVSKRKAEIDLLVSRRVYLELKTRLANGELIHRDDVERGRCERIKMVRGGLEALKRSLAPAVLELGEEATLDQAEALIWDYIEPLLSAFAGKSPARTGANGETLRRVCFPARGVTHEKETQAPDSIQSATVPPIQSRASDLASGKKE